MAESFGFFPGSIPYRLFLAPAVSTTMLAPLWCITETNVLEEANVLWSTVVVEVMTCVELWVGCPIMTKRIRLAYEEDTCSAWVRIPVLLNTKALSRGGVLRVYAKTTAPNRRNNY